MVSFEFQDFALHVDGDLAGQVAAGRPAVVTSAMLRTCAVRLPGHLVHAFGEILPNAGYAFDLGLPAKFSFGADFCATRRDLGGENGKLIDHSVNQSRG